jgi:hypothetical protein
MVLSADECWWTSNPEYLNLIYKHKTGSACRVLPWNNDDGRKANQADSVFPAMQNVIFETVRSHSPSVNESHSFLNGAMNEGPSRIRKDRAPENMAVLGQIALNLLKQEKTATGVTTPNKFN